MDVSGQLHASAALLPEKEPRYQLDKRLGGLQSRSGHSGEEKNYQPPPGIEPYNPDRPVRSLQVHQIYLKQCPSNIITTVYGLTQVIPKPVTRPDPILG
jgi:hypothetical protein